MAILPGCVSRSLLSLTCTLSTRFFTTWYRILYPPSTSNLRSSFRKLMSMGLECTKISCVVTSLQCICGRSDSRHGRQLPETEITQIDQIEYLVRRDGLTDINIILHPVRPEL